MSRDTIQRKAKEWAGGRNLLAEAYAEYLKRGLITPPAETPAPVVITQDADDSWKVCPQCGFTRYRLDVQPGHPDYGRYRCGCNTDITPEQAYTRRRKAANLPNLGVMRFSDVMKTPSRTNALKAAMGILEKGGGWITFWGSYGSGKSFLSQCMVNEACHAGRDGLYLLMPTFLEDMKMAFNPENDLDAGKLYRQALTADVLVVDEFDRFRATDWALERFTTLFLKRYQEQDKITVWVTNLEPGKSMTAPELAPFYSRMTEYPVIHMTDNDIRPSIGKTR